MISGQGIIGRICAKQSTMTQMSCTVDNALHCPDNVARLLFLLKTVARAFIRGLSRYQEGPKCAKPVYRGHFTKVAGFGLACFGLGCDFNLGICPPPKCLVRQSISNPEPLFSFSSTLFSQPTELGIVSQILLGKRKSKSVCLPRNPTSPQGQSGHTCITNS